MLMSSVDREYAESYRITPGGYVKDIFKLIEFKNLFGQLPLPVPTKFRDVSLLVANPATRIV